MLSFFVISFFCKSNIVSIKKLFTCNTVHIVGSACLCAWCIHVRECVCLCVNWHILLGVRVCALGVYMVGCACLCVNWYTLFGECVFVRLGVHIVGRVRVFAFGGTHCLESACLCVWGYTLLGLCVFVRWMRMCA